MPAKGTVERGLMRIDTTQHWPRLMFTETGLMALRTMMTDRRLADPERCAHIPTNSAQAVPAHCPGSSLMTRISVPIGRHDACSATGSAPAKSRTDAAVHAVDWLPKRSLGGHNREIASPRRAAVAAAGTPPGNRRCRAGRASHRLDINPRIEPPTATSFAGRHQAD